MPVVNFKCRDNYWKVYGCGLSELLQSEKLTDLRFVTMDSSGRNVRCTNAHQFLFTSKSPLLRDLCLEAKSKQHASEPVVLTLPNVDPESIQTLINYFYFGYADLDNRDDLEDICNLLGIDDIDDFETDVKWDGHLSLDQRSEIANEDGTDNEVFSSVPEILDAANTSRSESEAPSRRKCVSVMKRGVRGPSTSNRLNSRKHNKKTGIFPDGTFLKECGRCFKIFVKEKNYKAHALKCKDGSLIVNPLPQSKIILSSSKSLKMKSLSSEKYKCNFCDAIYDKIANVRYHTLTHFKHILLKKLPSSYPFECPDCQMVFRVKASLLRHYSFSHRHFHELASGNVLKGVRVA